MGSDGEGRDDTLTWEDLAPLFERPAGASDDEWKRVMWDALTSPVARVLLKRAVRAARKRDSPEMMQRDLMDLMADLWRKTWEKEGLARPTTTRRISPAAWLVQVAKNHLRSGHREKSALKRGGAGRASAVSKGEGDGGDAPSTRRGAQEVRSTKDDPQPWDRAVTYYGNEQSHQRKLDARAQLERVGEFVLAPSTPAPQRMAWLLVYIPSRLQEDHMEQAARVPNRARAGNTAGLVRPPADAWRLFRQRCAPGEGAQAAASPPCRGWEYMSIAWLMRSLHPGPEDVWVGEQPAEAKKARGTVQKWVKRLTEHCRTQLAQEGLR